MLPHRHPMWNSAWERAGAFVKAYPESASLAAFERQVLFDVDPAMVPAFVSALRRKRRIWTRRQGGAVRVFASRPDSISGIFPSATPVERFLASASIYIRRIASDVAARETAKTVRDALAAQEARDRLDASGLRLVALATRHMASGLNLAECRQTMWLVFSASAMEFLASFEPSFSADSAATTLVEAETSARRIASNLDLPKKIVALILKTGNIGATKKALAQGIRPRVPGPEISAVLADLVDRQQVAARPVRIAGSGKAGVRYFVEPPT